MKDFFDENAKNNLIEKTNSDYEDLLDIIIALLCDTKMPDVKLLDEEILNNEKFQKLYNITKDLRALAVTLNKGELQKFVSEKGFVLENLKVLQANLRHLSWQTQKIAEGDFSQRVDFMGDFSKSFNKMIFKLRENSVKLTNLANFDSLTKIPNRLSLDIFLEDSFAKSSKLCIFTIDIDRFKSINDRYGHDIGDSILIHVSNILKKQFRNTDFLARYGGEEFTAVLPNTDIDIAQKIASRAIKAVCLTPFKVENCIEIYSTISVGISERKPEDISFKEVLKRSDKALYAAKANGRNCFCTS